jgi:hypothetical protein
MVLVKGNFGSSLFDEDALSCLRCLLLAIIEN